MQANTIDEVIALMEEILRETEAKDSRLGYFAGLYYTTTLGVKYGIEAGKFEDPARMELFDVVFANLYFRAYTEYKSGLRTPDSWKLAFDATERFWPTVLQHLMLGMNAHLNFDLGHAAALVAPGPQIHALKSDFDKINDVLAGLVHEVERDLAGIWPFLKKILKWSGQADEFIINLSMRIARESAWQYAVDLATATPDRFAVILAEKDRAITQLGKPVAAPGPWVRFLLGIGRLTQRGTIKSRIRLLASNDEGLIARAFGYKLPE